MIKTLKLKRVNRQNKDQITHHKLNIFIYLRLTINQHLQIHIR